MSKRRHAREMAVQMLYQSDLGDSTADQVFSRFDRSEYSPRERAVEGGNGDRGSRRQEAERSADEAEQAFAYSKRLVEGTLEHREEVDELIRRQAENWRLERMPPVDRNILRLAVYELLYEVDVPKLVVLDEAIELAKKFGSENSGRFVNGLLDGLLKSRAFPGSLT